MRERALVVEDDAEIREVAQLILERAGFDVATEGDGRRALVRVRREPFDVVVLDLMLPSLNGFEVCKEIRRESMVPIVMLTAKTSTADVVAGLELGADDYITKPFEAAELLARVRASVRRASGAPDQWVERFGPIEIDRSSHVVRRRGEEVALSATEFRLLLELTRHPGQVLTRQLLLERVWNYDYLGDSRLVDMAVKRLRDKLEEVPGDPQMVKTVRGVGYRFDPPNGEG